MKELEKLADFVTVFRLEDAPNPVVDAAKYCILDTVANVLGAGDNELYSNVRKQFLSQISSKTEKVATVWGTKEQTIPSVAAFLNAMAGHTLELDDVHTGSKTHIGTVVIPAAWAVAESLGKSGKELLEAVICGYEVMSRIGMAFGVTSHRNKGWHVTSTAGTFGAAAACGKLLGFSAQQMIWAWGLAGTQSFGTWAFLTGGATNKVLHPARAAQLGLESCQLVTAGMRGSPEILCASDGGIIPMMSDEYDYSKVDRGVGVDYEILKMDKKPYPCCRSAHCAIDAAIELRDKYHIVPDAVENVTVDTYLVGYKQIGLTAGSRNPHLPTEAKFSTPYVTACALLNGKVGSEDFMQENIELPERRELLKRVVVQEDPQFSAQYPAHWGCRMTITMKYGSKYTKTVADPSGSVASPLTPAQLYLKVETTCSSYDKKDVQKLISDIDLIEKSASIPMLPLK